MSYATLKNRRRFSVMKFSIFLTLLALLIVSPVHPATKNSCIAGTYLVLEASGTQSLWTFSKDGTVQIASSAQEPLNFSDGHGAWKQTRSREARATILDFTYGEQTPPSAIARVDAQLSFSKKCTTVQGNFELRFFDPETEDPLDVSSDGGSPLTDTFSGRRVKVL